MELLTVSVCTGLDNRPHYTVVTQGRGQWPVATCGLAEGKSASQAKKEAEFLASSTVMFDMLEKLSQEYRGINPDFPLGAGKCAELAALNERAAALVDRFKTLKFIVR